MRLYVQAIKLIIKPHVITVKQGKYGRGNCQKLNLGQLVMNKQFSVSVIGPLKYCCMW